MNTKAVFLGGSVLLMIVLLAALAGLGRMSQRGQYAEELVFYCAAGLQRPVEAIIADYKVFYESTHGKAVHIEVHYGGSGTLLSQLHVAQSGDLYLAADAAYVERARAQGTVRESIPLATMKPVIALSERGRGKIESLQDLLEGDHRFGIGVPEGPAIGEATRSALIRMGQWPAFEQKATVTKPTVNDLANDVRIGAVDAAIVWDTIAEQYGLAWVTDPYLDLESVRVMIGVVEASEKPTAALHFARFLAAPEHGLQRFQEHGFSIVEGDRWADIPEVTFFSGGVNRRAMEPILEAFQAREGVRINTVFQGCGALNAQLATIRDQNPDMGFPDGYLLCDVYYLDPVRDWFEGGVAVSSTPIVIVTAKDNPHGIESLEDLARPGIRLVVGHPTHCTIGGLTERLFHAKGLYDAIAPNIVERQPSSGMMVPPVVSGAADASLAYYSDTLPERARLHVVRIDSEYAQAVQPFTVAHTSRHKQLMHRLYDFIGRSEEIYTELGFGWELGRSADEFEVIAPAGARPHRSGAEESR
jgi:molybdate transport system substrate-binding protein